MRGERMEYTSESTIDNPPEGEQVELIQKKSDAQDTLEDMEASAGRERKFEVDLTLRLKRGKTYVVPLLQGHFSNTQIEELIFKALGSRYAKNVIKAVLDKPDTGYNGKAN